MNHREKKLPAFGKKLLTRQKFNNPPFLVAICVGADAWETARSINTNGNTESNAVVITDDQDPKRIVWPVKNSHCVIYWSTGPGREMIINLVQALLRNEASSVTVFPEFADFDKPAFLFAPEKPGWIQTRERINVYFPKKEVTHVA